MFRATLREQREQENPESVSDENDKHHSALYKIIKKGDRYGDLSNVMLLKGRLP
jgi:hypothetical protein